MRKMLLIATFSVFAAGAAYAADASAGKADYDRACKSCHGADGTANPAIAKMMKVEMKDLKSPEVKAMSDDEIKMIITDGKGKMHPVKSVTGKQIDDVVAYVKSLK